MIWELLTNFGLVAPVVAIVTSQILKLIYYFIREGKFNYEHIFEAAGMPSSHAASVSSLTVAVGILQGWHSIIFAISVIFASIVMYDAAGVRRAAGNQAKILNKMLEDKNKRANLAEEELEELLGHSPIEVIVGSTVGILVTIILYLVFF
ncbi:MAG: divergent PAP2 family protein [bacterium]